MEQKVTELKTDQTQIKTYGPWFDHSFRGLRIMRRLTEAFPEDGYVSAKDLEIRDLTAVTCSGVARDNQSYKTIDQAADRAGSQQSQDGTGPRTGAVAIHFQFSMGRSRRQWKLSNARNCLLSGL